MTIIVSKFTMPITKVDDEGREYETTIMKFTLNLTWVESLQEHTIVMK